MKKVYTSNQYSILIDSNKISSERLTNKNKEKYYNGNTLSIIWKKLIKDKTKKINKRVKEVKHNKRKVK